MARGKFIWDEANKKLVPYEQYKRPLKTGVTVITDEMPETKHPCNGKVYTSKSKFRQETRARGCVEVGNEKMEFKRFEDTRKLDAAIEKAMRR